MSLTLKLASLAIRTFAKPVANSIKSRAREHETFRRVFIRFAQSLHRVDMRMRLGILHDSAAQERMHAREVAVEEAKRKTEAGTSTVRTEAEQARHDAELKQQHQVQQQAGTGKDEGKKKEEKKPKIRPLSETRAIELGANFASESFIFAVAAGLLIFERWWSRRKENAKDEHVVERIRALEEQAEKVESLEQELRRLRGEPKLSKESSERPDTAVQVTDVAKGSKDSEKQTQVVVSS